MMGDLTANISRSELKCKCGKCGFDTVDWETLEVVQDCADHFAEQLGVERVVVNVNSAARCLEYNRSIGSTDGSQHTKARAIDFTINDVKPADVYAYLCRKYPDRYGLGSYATFTHADSRSGPPARW